MSHSRRFPFSKRAIEALPAHEPESPSREAEYSDAECIGLHLRGSSRPMCRVIDGDLSLQRYITEKSYSGDGAQAPTRQAEELRFKRLAPPPAQEVGLINLWLDQPLSYALTKSFLEQKAYSYELRDIRPKTTFDQRPPRTQRTLHS